MLGTREGWGEYHKFSCNFFCHTVPKIFVGEPFSVSLFSGIENFCSLEDYVTIFNFLSSFFCVTVPKNFVGESFSVSPISGIDQLLQTVKNKTTVLNLVFKEFLQTSAPPLISVLYAKGYHDYALKIFCLLVSKSFVEEAFCVSENFWYRKLLGI